MPSRVGRPSRCAAWWMMRAAAVRQVRVRGWPRSGPIASCPRWQATVPVTTEEALRALFAGDRARLEAQISAWPEDIRSTRCAWLTKMRYMRCRVADGYAPVTGEIRGVALAGFLLSPTAGCSGRLAAHVSRASSAGHRDWPQGVRLYSTFGGTWG